jgi:hypothetical protein
MDLQDVRRMDWIDLAEDTRRWRALVNAVMNHRVPQHVGIFWPAEQMLASQKGPCSVELVG